MSFIFFTDRDLGNVFPDILSAGGLTVERHGQHFSADCSDEEWLRVIGERGWIAVTRDTRIRYKPNELAAILTNRVALLVVVGKAPHAELAHGFVRTVPRIVRFLERHEPPLIAKVHRPAAADLLRNRQAPGHVSLWYPRQERRG